MILLSDDKKEFIRVSLGRGTSILKIAIDLGVTVGELVDFIKYAKIEEPPLDARGLLEAIESLRLCGITISLASVHPFNPHANYCKPFNHDEKYKVQVWDEDYQRWGKAYYGKTPQEAFREAAMYVLEKKS